MLSNNTNSSPSLNKSVIIIYDTKILIPACTNSISNQILVHVLSVSFISNILSMPIAEILIFKLLFFFYENNRSPMNDINIAEHQRRHIMAIIKGGLLIVVFYILFAFLYNCLWLMKSLNNITSIYFIRWFIEATSVQFIMFASYTEILHSWIIENEPGAHMTCVIMLKILLFFVARSAETDPVACLNFVRREFFFYM